MRSVLCVGLVGGKTDAKPVLYEGGISRTTLSSKHVKRKRKNERGKQLNNLKMNEQTAKLLEQLANKLGTTSEYLWGIMLKQAPIDATVTLLKTLFLFIVGWGLWKAHKKLLSKPIGQDYYDSYYEKYEVGAVLPMLLVTVSWGTMMIICFCYFGSIVSGYFNPEYWALKEILNSLRGFN